MTDQPQYNFATEGHPWNETHILGYLRDQEKEQHKPLIEGCRARHDDDQAKFEENLRVYANILDTDFDHLMESCKENAKFFQMTPLQLADMTLRSIDRLKQVIKKEKPESNH